PRPAAQRQPPQAPGAASRSPRLVGVGGTLALVYKLPSVHISRAPSSDSPPGGGGGFAPTDGGTWREEMPLLRKAFPLAGSQDTKKSNETKGQMINHRPPRTARTWSALPLPTANTMPSPKPTNHAKAGPAAWDEADQ